MSSPTVEQLIQNFQLVPHVEGGYFREDFKSEIWLPKEITGRGGDRSFLTTCYYLLGQGDRSIFHRLKSDEIWHFYSGGPIDMYEIDAQGCLTKIVLGSDVAHGHQFKHLVKRNTWFGVLPQKETEYAFFGATVFPGFEFDDWEKGDKEFLINLCPKAAEIIRKLT